MAYYGEVTKHHADPNTEDGHTEIDRLSFAERFNNKSQNTATYMLALSGFIGNSWNVRLRLLTTKQFLHYSETEN